MMEALSSRGLYSTFVPYNKISLVGLSIRPENRVVYVLISANKDIEDVNKQVCLCYIPHYNIIYKGPSTNYVPRIS